VAATVALALLGVALLVALVRWTPWHTLDAPPGGPVAVDPARDFTAAELAREDAFHRAVRPPGYASLAVALGVAVALGLTSWGARLVSWAAAPLGGGWVWHVLLGGLAVSLLGWLVTLPFSMWSEVVLRRYGLSTRDWAGFAADVGKGLLVSVVVLLVALVALYGLIRAVPRFWWAPAAAFGAVLVVALVFVYPLTVEPLFNKFTPMRQEPTRSSLLTLARADGVPVRDVLVADASRRTTTLNAYVSGFGSTKRIVVYDTALREFRPEELRLITAHELGHTKSHDVLHGAVIGALGVAALACLLYLVLGWEPLLRRAGVERLADPRSLALVLALVAVVTTVSAPVELLASRRAEARADVHALDLTRDPDAFIAMQRRLAVNNLSDLDPNPLVYGLFATHPTVPERIALARTWALLPRKEDRGAHPGDHQ
jgi:STE24 endopeptidase